MGEVVKDHDFVDLDKDDDVEKDDYDDKESDDDNNDTANWEEPKFRFTVAATLCISFTGKRLRIKRRRRRRRSKNLRRKGKSRNRRKKMDYEGRRYKEDAKWERRKKEKDKEKRRRSGAGWEEMQRGGIDDKSEGKESKEEDEAVADGGGKKEEGVMGDGEIIRGRRKQKSSTKNFQYNTRIRRNNKMKKHGDKE
ncbi:hypothetical protein KSS87_005490 [Heliosperma pusillum]|nr:hypothetical protein KSS87_005490 [Heliosperma pusillum]